MSVMTAISGNVYRGMMKLGTSGQMFFRAGETDALAGGNQRGGNQSIYVFAPPQYRSVTVNPNSPVARALEISAIRIEILVGIDTEVAFIRESDALNLTPENPKLLAEMMFESAKTKKEIDDTVVASVRDRFGNEYADLVAQRKGEKIKGDLAWQLEKSARQVASETIDRLTGILAKSQKVSLNSLLVPQTDGDEPHESDFIVGMLRRASFVGIPIENIKPEHRPPHYVNPISEDFDTRPTSPGFDESPDESVDSASAVSLELESDSISGSSGNGSGNGAQKSEADSNPKQTLPFQGVGQRPGFIRGLVGSFFSR